MLALCVLLITAGSASAAYVTHSGSTDPTTEGFSLYTEYTTFIYGAGNELSTDYWYTSDTTGTGMGLYSAGVTTTELQTYWEMTANMRLAAGAAQSATDSGVADANLSMSFVDSDANTSMRVDFQTDGWHVIGAGSYPEKLIIESGIDTQTAYHVYKVTMTPTSPGSDSADDSFKFYRDGTLKLTLARSQIGSYAGTNDQVAFGIASNWYNGDGHWGSYSFTPEPATLSVLAIGAGLLFVRPWRRK
jgi:hypothetical protein